MSETDVTRMLNAMGQGTPRDRHTGRVLRMIVDAELRDFAAASRAIKALDALADRLDPGYAKAQADAGKLLDT